MKQQRSSSLRYLVAWQKTIFDFAKSIFSRVPPRVYFISAFIGLSILFALLTARYGSTDLDYKLNDIVKRDIISPTDITIRNDQRTKELQEDAAAKVKKIFAYDPKVQERSDNALVAAFSSLRRNYQDALDKEFGTTKLSPQQTQSSKYNAFLDRFIDSERQKFQLNGGEAAIRALAKQQFSEDLQQTLLDRLNAVMHLYIYPDDRIEDVQGNEIPIIAQGEHRQVNSSSLASLSQARSQLERSINTLEGFTEPQRRAIAAMMMPLVSENLSYDATATQQARDQARAATPDVTEVIKRDEPIATKGEKVDEHLLYRIELVRHMIGQPNYILRVFGLTLFHAILLYGLWLISQKTKRHNLSATRTFAVAVIALLVTALVIDVGTIISENYTGQPFSNSVPQYQFVIPYATAALLITLLVDLKLAYICALIVGIYTALLSNGSIEMSLFAMTSSFFAVYSGGRYRQRNVVMRAGGMVALGNILLANIAIFISGQVPTFKLYFYDMGLAALGGVLAGMIVSGLIPVNESVFNILTDVKLLELSNADLPLLRRMALMTPGSHQHSYMVASLAEEAAKAIGANALLVRIGCYYHDIGKTAAPNMFIENQSGGPNPHDHIDPKKSARIIANHVKRGIEMARDEHLPEKIVDLIPQHHGTRLLHYFYNKAKEKAALTGDEVLEVDFRYPGPKPQSKEAAILMLADSSEAAIRSLQDHSEPVMRAMIKKVFDDIIADGQLDESNLTMREISRIREALIRAFKSHYHERVRYPGFNPEESSEHLSGEFRPGDLPQPSLKEHTIPSASD
ncbi:MAG TPA: HDIG domain-containing protein [Blastocatellia bacterium]|nr:HDIG domain-containing protein [Blastocatellia bacterium]